MSMSPVSGSHLAGAVDLSALRKPAAAPRTGAAEGAGAAPGATASNSGQGQFIEADIAAIGELIPTSAEVPLLVELTSPRADHADELHADLVTAVSETGGKLRLARLDVDEHPQAIQAFQLQSLPTLVAVIAGKSIPVFEGVHPLDQIREVVKQILTLAEREGVRGSVAGVDVSGAEPIEPPLPPLHQQARDAMEAGDFDGAAEAYNQALLEAPADLDAKVGLARVNLFQRTAGVKLQDARAAAAAAPQSMAAQMLAADMDILGGHIEDAFLRLIDLVKTQEPAERAPVRERLLELFDVVGTVDERVVLARRQLANALF